MNHNLRKQLEDGLRAQGKALGVDFVKLELTSAAKEIGLFDQIELNYPSKEVVQTIVTNYPDPENPLRTITTPVEHVSRVLMTEAEAIEFHSKLAQDRVLEHFASNPDGLKEFIGKLGNGSKPKGTKGAKGSKKGTRK